MRRAEATLHELLVLLGHAALGNKMAQDCFGGVSASVPVASPGSQQRSVLAQLVKLPVHYWRLEERLRVGALFPTLLALADGHAANRDTLSDEVNLGLIAAFVHSEQRRIDALMDDMSFGSDAGLDALPASLRLESRFPASRWAPAVEFLVQG
jgi:hypothetical protein